MADYGIKVSQPGYDVATATPSQLVFSSKYQTPKIHSQGSGTLTDSSRTATIAHGLGYIPSFLVHTTVDSSFASDYGDTTDFFISPFANNVDGGHVDRNVIAWADSTNLYIKARPDFGKLFFDLSSTNQNECMAGEIVGLVNETGLWYIGKTSGYEVNGALRFGNVTIAKNQSIYSATLNLHIDTRGGSGTVYSNVLGIDEDNTGNFNSGTTAHARSRTSASTQWNTGLSAGDTSGVNVKSIVEEITTRTSWSSGNAMAFVVINNGTADGNYYEENSGWGFYSSYSSLEVLLSSTLASYKYTIFKNQIQ